MSNSRPRYVGSVRWADDMIPAIRKGLVLVNGGKASIYDRGVPDGEKAQQVDVMQHVTVTEKGSTVTLTGQSLFAVHKIHTSDSDVEVIVDVKGCQDCR